MEGSPIKLYHWELKFLILVIMGATRECIKELVAIDGGYRESAESCLEVLHDLKERGRPSPKLSIGDGALGFWKAIRQRILPNPLIKLLFF